MRPIRSIWCKSALNLVFNLFLSVFLVFCKFGLYCREIMIVASDITVRYELQTISVFIFNMNLLPQSSQSICIWGWPSRVAVGPSRRRGRLWTSVLTTRTQRRSLNSCQRLWDFELRKLLNMYSSPFLTVRYWTCEIIYIRSNLKLSNTWNALYRGILYSKV